MNIAALESLTARPEEAYERSTDYIWTDDHVGKQMLEFHLNPDLDSASLKHTTIDEQVAWILERIEPAAGARLLDIGCGPGLYCERFAAAGLSVTGMDFNRHSVEFAKEQAGEKDLKIEYIFGDYRDLAADRRFDAVTLINRDFGALTPVERDALVAAVHTCLSPGGLFIFDNLSLQYYRELTETQTVQVTDGESFWAARPHIVLGQVYLYDECAAQLDQYVVIEEDGTTRHFRNWLTFNTEEQVIELLQNAGFEVIESNPFLSDTVYTDPAKYLGFVCRKKA